MKYFTDKNAVTFCHIL